MRTFVFSIISFFLLITAAAAAPPVPPPGDCIQKCEQQKTSCLAQYTKEDARSGRYVTPEGRDICYKGFNGCKSSCPKVTATPPAPPPGDCMQKCEQQKTSCLAQYTKEDARSGRYVTPEGRDICYKGFNGCKSSCPKTAR